MRTLGGRRHDDSPGGRRCRMCGTTVAVGADGRCPLGHPVQTAASAPVEQVPPAPPPAVPAPADVPAVPSLTLPVPPVVAPVVHGPDGAVDDELGQLDEPPAAPADAATRRRLATMLGGGGVALLAGLAAAVAMAL